MGTRCALWYDSDYSKQDVGKGVFGGAACLTCGFVSQIWPEMARLFNVESVPLLGTGWIKGRMYRCASDRF